MNETLELLPVDEPIKVTEQQFKRVKNKFEGYIFFMESYGEYFIKIATQNIGVRAEIQKELEL